MEFDSVREAMEFLISYNESPREDMKIDGHEPSFEDLQEANREALYSACDLLGMSDLYLHLDEQTA